MDEILTFHLHIKENYLDAEKLKECAEKLMGQYCIKKNDGSWASYHVYNTSYHKKEPDVVLLSVSSWRSNGSEFLKQMEIDNPDSKRSNELLSNKLYYEVIVPFQKKISNGKLNKKVRNKFLVK